MIVKHLFFVSLLCSTSHLVYSSHTSQFAGPAPLLEESQQDYPGYLSTYRHWIEAGHSTKEGDAAEYHHHVTFKKIEDSLESSPPSTKLEANCFFTDQQEQKVHVASYDLSFPHLIQTASEEQDKRGYHYSEGVLYRPLHQRICYKFPALQGVEGCEQEMNYIKYNYVLPSQEVHEAAFKFKIEPTQETLPNGYYGSRLRQEQPHSYIYSHNKELFLMRYQRESLDLVNHLDIKVNFTFLFIAPHKIVLKPGYTTNNPQGFFPDGIYGHLEAQQPGQWQRVEKDLSLKPGDIPTLSHSEGLYFQTIELDPHTSNAQVLQDLRLSSATQMIESLDFKGRVFGAEKQSLSEVLKAMTQLRSLNLSKEDTTIDYNDLIPTLKTLTNLKSLNLTNGQVTEENRRQLTAIAGLEIIPAPQPAPKSSTPAANSNTPDQTTAVPKPAQPTSDNQAPGDGQNQQSVTPKPAQPAPKAPNSEASAPAANSKSQAQTTAAPKPAQLAQVPVADPKAPAAIPVVAPKEVGEPKVEPTPTAKPTAPAVEPVTEAAQVPAATLKAPAQEGSSKTAAH